jgi:hypothetical protein
LENPPQVQQGSPQLESLSHFISTIAWGREMLQLVPEQVSENF